MKSIFSSDRPAKNKRAIATLLQSVGFEAATDQNRHGNTYSEHEAAESVADVDFGRDVHVQIEHLHHARDLQLLIDANSTECSSCRPTTPTIARRVFEWRIGGDSGHRARAEQLRLEACLSFRFGGAVLFLHASDESKVKTTG